MIYFKGRESVRFLLERLALLAVRNGFLQFTATTHVSNQPMLEVFRRSGFPVHEKREDSYMQLHFSVEPTQSSVERSETVDRVFTTASLLPVFQPKSIAVVGASRDPSSIGYRILEELIRNRYQGPVYPVNPKASRDRFDPRLSKRKKSAGTGRSCGDHGSDSRCHEC